MKIFLSFLFFNFLFINAQNNLSLEPFLEDHLLGFPNVRDFTFNKQSGDAIVSVQNYIGDQSVLVQLNCKGGIWQEPRVLSFSGKFHDLEPFFSEDGLTLYFASNRPKDKLSEETKDFDIWYVKRPHVDAKWQEPINMGSPVNSERDEFYPVITRNGNIYFTSVVDKTKKDDIYMAKKEFENYKEPTALPETVNTDGYEFNAYISPDESYLIFSGYDREDGLGSGDLYISYRSETGKWTTANNLGTAINSDKMDYCPYVDGNNNVLYFTSKRTDSNQNDSTLTIENIRNWKQQNKGLSKIYKVDFSNWIKEKE